MPQSLCVPCLTLRPTPTLSLTSVDAMERRVTEARQTVIQIAASTAEWGGTPHVDASRLLRLAQ